MPEHTCRGDGGVDCPGCEAELDEAIRLYGGGRHHHLKPVDREWKSREQLMREYAEEEDRRGR